MYTAMYLYPVPARTEDAFRAIEQEAGDRYQSHGALDHELYRAADVGPKHGCAGFESAVDLRNDELLYVGMDHFHDRAHHDDVMDAVDTDDRVAELFEELTDLVDIDRVVRGAFDRVS